MIDISHILSLPPDERDDEIRKLVVLKPWKHKLYIGGHGIRYGGKLQIYTCHNCEQQMELEPEKVYETNTEQPFYAFRGLTTDETSCSIPDRIALDWNLAMKMRDEILKDTCIAGNFCMALKDVYNAERGLRGHAIEDIPLDYSWAVLFAQSRHYILAACVAKENKE